MRKIFALRSQGKSILGIATQLNSEGILTPRDYWYKLKGEPNPRKLSHKWSDVTVRGILSNEAYLGNMIQNKTGHISYKNKKIVMRPEEDRIRVDNTHEPIIDRETWDRVQALFQKKVTFRNNAMGIPYLFSGLLECADCGCRLKGVRDSRRKASDPSQLWSAYKCGTYRQAEGEGMVVWVKIQRCKVMLGSVGVSLLRNVLRSFHYFKFQPIF